MAWTVSFWILTIPAFWYAGSPIDLGVTQVIAVAWKYVLASALAGCATAMTLRGIGAVGAASSSIGHFARIVVVSVLYGALYIGSAVLLNRGYAFLYQFAALVQEAIPWARPSRTNGPVNLRISAEQCTPRDTAVRAAPSATRTHEPPAIQSASQAVAGRCRQQ